MLVALLKLALAFLAGCVVVLALIVMGTAAVLNDRKFY